MFFSAALKDIRHGKNEVVSLGDSLLYFFKGAKEFLPDTVLDIPVLEISAVLCLIFIISHYINSDKKGFGKSIMLASGSPVKWWLCKFIVMLVATAEYMALIIISNAVTGVVVLKGSFKCSLKYFSGITLSSDVNMYLFLAMCFTGLVTFASISLLISYVISPLYGFVINLVLMTCSVRYMKWYFFFNYCMAYRIDECYASWKMGAVFMLLINIFTLAAGVIYSERRDFF
jgi:hypothetical protein